MDNIDTSLPELSKLIEQRLALLRSLAESLEFSSLALVQNDAEAIARGAAHQAELCRQWSALEEALRHETGRRSAPPSTDAFLMKPYNPRGCKPSGRRSQPGSVISRECTGRCCGTWSAVWPS